MSDGWLMDAAEAVHGPYEYESSCFCWGCMTLEDQTEGPSCGECNHQHPESYEPWACEVCAHDI